ncbi:MAG: 4Fe-4S binding protein [Firmicutes bacterium]|nr:4Fe-4S binding protein [Bacillota bacterium]
MHLHHKLQELLHNNPVGAPKSEEFIEILEILFPPGEVEMALLLSFSFKKLGDIAKEAGIPEEEASRILEGMADKGTILSKKTGDGRVYALLPNYPGLFEYPIMKGMDAETQKRLGNLWHTYYMKDMVHELALADPPWKRVLPTEEAMTDEVLPYEVASELIRTKSKSICLGICPCRTIEQKCDKPTDTCLAFDGAADFMIERGIAKKITVEEAIEVLKRTEEAGLVHLGSNNKNNLLFICNYCPCCCHIFRQYTEFNYPQSIGKSSYLAGIQADECNGCGICAEERCPVKAIAMLNDVAALDSAKCIGCGLCVSTCPTKAISLLKREEYQEPPDTLNQLVQTVWKNKQEKNRSRR